jgi:hypothetical protein
MFQTTGILLVRICHEYRRTTPLLAGHFREEATTLGQRGQRYGITRERVR